MAATLSALTFAPVTNEGSKALRALLKPVCKPAGVKISVKKGTGSMSYGYNVQASYDAPTTPALRVAVIEALRAAGFEHCHGPAVLDTEIRFAVEHGHSTILLFVNRYTVETITR